MLKCPDCMGVRVKATLALTLLLPASGMASNPLQADMDAVLRADPRNSGITVSVSDRGDRSMLIYNLTSVAPTNSMADVFRVFLQFASAEKGREFKSVELSFRGNPKFLISGQYFKRLGEEFGTQNPVYTVRTFPENLMKLDGSRAYPSWGGGLIGVVGKQLEDSNDFHRQWWLDDFTAGAPGGRADLNTTPAGLPEAPQIPSQPHSQVLATKLSSGEGSPKPAHVAQNTFDADTSRSSAPSSVPMQLPTWLSVFPGSRDQVTTTAVGMADVSYTAPVSPDDVIKYYREGLDKRGIATHIGFNGVGTTIQASLDNEGCVIRIANVDAGTTVNVKCANGQIGRSAYAAAPAALPTLPPGVHRVEYAISGSAGAVGLTYRNATGGTEQNDAGLPASMSFYAAIRVLHHPPMKSSRHAVVALRLLGVTSLHVCSPACLPAAPSVLLRAKIGTAGWPHGPGEGSTDLVSPAPLTCVAVQGGGWFAQGSRHPKRL